MKEYYNFFFMNSIIKDIFFFDLSLDSQCKCNKNCYSTNYMLYLDIKKFQTIQNIINECKLNLTCNICKIKKLSIIEFLTFPQVLIIVIEKHINSIKFKYENQIVLKSKEKEMKYELISVIKIKEKNDEVDTFFNSPINKTWYKCNEELEHKKMEIDELFSSLNNQQNNIPLLLIYEKLEK